MRKNNRVQPRWHTEKCLECHQEFEELSDPRASLHLCADCIHVRLGISRHDAPLQKLDGDDAWWDRFVEEFELHRAANLSGAGYVATEAKWKN